LPLPGGKSSLLNMIELERRRDLSRTVLTVCLGYVLALHLLIAGLANVTQAVRSLDALTSVITQGVGRRGWREAERSARAPPLRGTLEADSLASWDAPISNA
jgi:hypothetical protein